jgi:phosphoglycerate dehydrogenase-like enzyme
MDGHEPYSLLVLPDNPPALLSGQGLKSRLEALAQKVEWYSDNPAGETEIIARARDAEALISTRATVKFGGTVLAACPRLKIIARAGTGVGHIDLEAARDRGITVSNTPGYATPYVAEHALTLALSVSRQADVVSLHLSLSSMTERLVGRKELGLMTRTAILVNTARAGLVDEAALTEALQQKTIAGAGLDVFEPEPLPSDHPFTRLENVVLSPHAGGITQNGVLRALEMAVEGLECFAAGNPIYAVAIGSRR